MNTPNIILLVLLVLGVVSKSNVIAAAAGILLVIKMVNVPWLFPVLERRGLEIGLLFLVLSVLVPFATGRIPLKEISLTMTSITGLVAVLSGIIATHLNGKGLDLLTLEPQLMIGLVVGSIIGIVFFGGVPIGPLMAAGVTVVLLQILRLFGI
ncbi:uncharacterized membrane protein (DUF441 family) [Desulfitispora alkaliphila]|uniref:DUF441 domain-containing protein n=1 Tax=Desulfitispora alkaliphila TaxID=622674 RepID=UPI003D225FA6